MLLWYDPFSADMLPGFYMSDAGNYVEKPNCNYQIEREPCNKISIRKSSSWPFCPGACNGKEGGWTSRGKLNVVCVTGTYDILVKEPLSVKYEEREWLPVWKYLVIKIQVTTSQKVCASSKEIQLSEPYAMALATLRL